MADKQSRMAKFVSPVSTSRAVNINFAECPDTSSAFLLLIEEIYKVLVKVDLSGMKQALLLQQRTPRGIQFRKDLCQRIEKTMSVDALLNVLVNSKYLNWIDLQLLEILVISLGLQEAELLINKYKNIIFPIKLTEVLDNAYFLKHKKRKKAYIANITSVIQKEPDDITLGDLQYYREHSVIKDIAVSCLLKLHKQSDSKINISSFSNIGCDRPTLKLLHIHVIPHISSKWHDLGLELLEQEDEIELHLINANYSNDISQCCRKMFVLWLNRDPAATWDRLIKALREVDLNNLATTIEGMFKDTVSDTSRGDKGERKILGYAHLYGVSTPTETILTEKKLNQDVIKWILEARTTGNAIKVRYGKVILSGSCASGKTSFFRLIMKKKIEDQYKSTGLADAHRVIFTTKAYIQPSTSGENVEFEVLDFDCEITQLRSYVHKKINNAASLSTVPDTAHKTTESESAVEATSTSELITEIETVIADNSETEQIPKEVTKKIECTDKIWDILTFVDTGGQPEYISMLPAVNSSVMLTFVVHKMEGGAASLDSPVTVVHSGDHCFKPYCLEYSNLDLIKTLISFTNDVFLQKKPFLDEVSCKEGSSASYLSFIGSHSDKVTENDVNEIDKVLARTVADSELENVLAKVNPKYQHLIPVNNTTAGQSDEDTNASKIRSKIYHLLENQPIYEVPYVWLLLELEVRKACEDRGSCFITYSEVLELCKQKGLMNDNEDFIRNGLKFHHLFGVLLYFDEVEGIRDLIITDHKWLFDKLTDIVLHFYYTDLTSKYLNDFKQGIFNKSLIDQMNLATEFKKSGIDVETFDVNESFLNLLQHLKIIAPIENSTKYFMPCLLKSCNFAENDQEVLQSYGTNCIVTNDNPNLPIEPLLIQFTLCSSSDQVGSFPRGVFCCLIVQLLQDYRNDWRFQWSPNVKKVFSNLVTFYVNCKNCGHYVTLIDRLFFLEVQVTHKSNVSYGSTIYHHISCVIGEALHKVGRSLNFHEFNLSYGFLCRECDKPEVHMTKLLKKDATVLFCYCNQPTEVTLSHKVWFDAPTFSGDFCAVSQKRSPKVYYTKKEHLGDNGEIEALGSSHIPGPSTPTQNMLTKRDDGESEAVSSVHISAATVPTRNILDEKPKMWKMKKIVIPEVKAHWEDLAYSMDYEIAQVDAIKENGKDVGERCSKLFKDWLETPHGCSPKTWGKLIERIRDVDELYAAADRIQERLLEPK